MTASQAGKVLANSMIVQYAHLISGNNVLPLIQQAYGPQGLGILFVNGIPNYPQQRKKTLKLFHKLANLPKETLKKYERPEIFHSKGWSCGVEQFQGKYDTSKGSYYVNTASDEAYPISAEEEKLFTPDERPFFCPNIWVDDIPQIETNVKSLSRMMMDVGALLALQIDAYAKSRVGSYPERLLHDMIKNGKRHTGRMLHYFPYQTKGELEDDWCGWHNDHGALTALTSALYTDKNGQETTIPIKTGGLYAKNRLADMARISIPQNMLAFQLGQSMQILSGGYLEATPHCVVRSDELAGKGVARNTYAIFMDPPLLSRMTVPEGVNPEKVTEKAAYKITPIKSRWQNGMLYKEFHKKSLELYS